MPDTLDSLYQSLLGRSADSGGKDYYQGWLNSGKTMDDVKASIAGSSEAKAFSSGVKPAHTAADMDANRTAMLNQGYIDTGMGPLLSPDYFTSGGKLQSGATTGTTGTGTVQLPATASALQAPTAASDAMASSGTETIDWTKLLSDYFGQMQTQQQDWQKQQMSAWQNAMTGMISRPGYYSAQPGTTGYGDGANTAAYTRAFNAAKTTNDELKKELENLKKQIAGGASSQSGWHNYSYSY